MLICGHPVSLANKIFIMASWGRDGGGGGGGVKKVVFHHMMIDHSISSKNHQENLLNDSTHFFPVIALKRSIESHAHGANPT